MRLSVIEITVLLKHIIVVIRFTLLTLISTIKQQRSILKTKEICLCLLRLFTIGILTLNTL